MARNSTMIPLGTGRGPGKVIGLLVLVGLLALVIHDPTGSAHFVRTIVEGLGRFLDAMDSSAGSH
jgi:hypothetical protein